MGTISIGRFLVQSEIANRAASKLPPGFEGPIYSAHHSNPLPGREYAGEGFAGIVPEIPAVQRRCSPARCAKTRLGRPADSDPGSQDLHRFAGSAQGARRIEASVEWICFVTGSGTPGDHLYDPLPGCPIRFVLEFIGKRLCGLRVRVHVGD